jgi:hypothetical protein
METVPPGWGNAAQPTRPPQPGARRATRSRRRPADGAKPVPADGNRKPPCPSVPFPARRLDHVKLSIGRVTPNAKGSAAFAQSRPCRIGGRTA